MFEYHEWDVVRSLSVERRVDSEVFSWGRIGRCSVFYDRWEFVLKVLRLSADYLSGFVCTECCNVRCEHCQEYARREIQRRYRERMIRLGFGKDNLL